jgi:hypothetical protein
MVSQGGLGCSQKCHSESAIACAFDAEENGRELIKLEVAQEVL